MFGKIEDVRYCPVISVDDETDSGLIKVRLHPYDDDKTINEIPYAFPLLPKMFYVKPKVLEGVLVFLAIANDGNSQRYYIGPVISQENKLYIDRYMYADSFMRGSISDPDIAPHTKPEVEGILPTNDDVMVRGRKNADIQITEDDVRLRSGVKLVNEMNHQDMEFNENDPAYIKLKYHTGGLLTKENTPTSGEKKQVNSTATIVADKINLFSNTSDEKNVNLADRKDLIADDDLRKAINEAYKLPYGEKLVEILSIFIDAFLKHTHPFPMKTPCVANGIPELELKKTELLDNGKLLSDTVRIN